MKLEWFPSASSAGPRPELVVVVPTADAGGSTFRGFRDSLAGAADLLAVIDRGPGFSFGRSLNAGVAAALERHPRVIGISNDDVRFAPPGGPAGALASLRSRLGPTTAYVAPLVNGRRNDAPVPRLDAIWRLWRWRARGLEKPYVLYSVVSSRWIHRWDSPWRTVAARVLPPHPFSLWAADALARIAPFDEAYSGEPEDVDPALAVAKAGWAPTLDPRTNVLHEGGATVGKERNVLFGWRPRGRDQFDRMLTNWTHFALKWGGDLPALAPRLAWDVAGPVPGARVDPAGRVP